MRMASNCFAACAVCFSGGRLVVARGSESDDGLSPASAVPEERELMAEMDTVKLVDNELGLEGTRAFQGLENGHHFAGGNTQRVQRGGEAFDTWKFAHHLEPAFDLVHRRVGRRHGYGLAAVVERVGLADREVGSDRNRQ